MKILESGYTIRSARVEELTLLAQIERSAAVLFLDTPYAFLVNDRPLSIDFVQQRFQAGQVWVAVDLDDAVVGFAITREVDDTIYLQEMDVDPAHGRRGIGAALVKTVCDWAHLHGYDTISLSTFRDLPWNAPFYAKLGFRILDESELTIGFQQIRRQELEAGLPISERVIMYCQSPPPNIDRFTHILHQCIDTITATTLRSTLITNIFILVQDVSLPQFPEIVLRTNDFFPAQKS